MGPKVIYFAAALAGVSAFFIVIIIAHLMCMKKKERAWYGNISKGKDEQCVSNTVLQKIRRRYNLSLHSNSTDKSRVTKDVSSQKSIFSKRVTKKTRRNRLYQDIIISSHPKTVASSTEANEQKTEREHSSAAEHATRKIKQACLDMRALCPSLCDDIKCHCRIESKEKRRRTRDLTSFPAFQVSDTEMHIRPVFQVSEFDAEVCSRSNSPEGSLRVSSENGYDGSRSSSMYLSPNVTPQFSRQSSVVSSVTWQDEKGRLSSFIFPPTKK